MIKKLIYASLLVWSASSMAQAFSAVRYVQISTNSLTVQTGGVNITSASVVGLAVSSNTILTGATFYQDGSAWIHGKEVLSGRWLQFVSSTTAIQTTTTSATYGNTTLGITITPTSTSSKIILVAVGTLGINETVAADNSAFATFARGGVNLAGAQGFATLDVNTAATDSYNNIPCNMFYIDSPNSTSALTYTVQIKASGGTAKWNNATMTSYLYAIELAQ